MTPLAEVAPFLALILVGLLPNEIWRMLGLLVSRGIDENSELLVWVRAVATAILAGVIAKVTLMPPGALAGVPLAARLAAIAVGFVGFFAVRRSVFAGVLAGELALVVGALLLAR
jgi:Branched-chain amino acid transport protein (AzlD)